MRSWRAMHNLLVVSANSKETAINTEQSLDTSMLVALGDVINLEPRRESNADELIGKEEPDAVYDLGAVAAAPMNFEKAQHNALDRLNAVGMKVGDLDGSKIGLTISLYDQASTGIQGVIDKLSALKLASSTIHMPSGGQGAGGESTGGGGTASDIGPPSEAEPYPGTLAEQAEGQKAVTQNIHIHQRLSRSDVTNIIAEQRRRAVRG